MSRPDRVALWAVLLCLLLLVVAAASAHGAVGLHMSFSHHTFFAEHTAALSRAR